MSDQKTHVSGISNSIVNTGTAGNITNNVHLTGLNGTPQEKVEISALLQQLEIEIAKVPSDSDDAESLAKKLKVMIIELESRKPDKEVVQVQLDGLKKAAQNVAAVVPTILPLTIDIAKRILSSF